MTVPIVDVAAVVADKLGLPAMDALVIEATAAAWRYAALQVQLIEADDPTPDIPDDNTVTHGLIGFARTMYLDAQQSRAQAVPLADGMIETVWTPEDLWRHWRHYFLHLQRSWGVA